MTFICGNNWRITVTNWSVLIPCAASCYELSAFRKCLPILRPRFLEGRFARCGARFAKHDDRRPGSVRRTFQFERASLTGDFRARGSVGGRCSQGRHDRVGRLVTPHNEIISSTQTSLGQDIRLICRHLVDLIFKTDESQIRVLSWNTRKYKRFDVLLICWKRGLRFRRPFVREKRQMNIWMFHFTFLSGEGSSLQTLELALSFRISAIHQSLFRFFRFPLNNQSSKQGQWHYSWGVFIDVVVRGTAKLSRNLNSSHSEEIQFSSDRLNIVFGMCVKSSWYYIEVAFFAVSPRTPGRWISRCLNKKTNKKTFTTLYFNSS